MSQSSNNSKVDIELLARNFHPATTWAMGLIEQFWTHNIFDSIYHFNSSIRRKHKLILNIGVQNSFVTLVVMCQIRWHNFTNLVMKGPKSCLANGFRNSFWQRWLIIAVNNVESGNILSGFVLERITITSNLNILYF
jgi:hypothetical protein